MASHFPFNPQQYQQQGLRARIRIERSDTHDMRISSPRRLRSPVSSLSPLLLGLVMMLSLIVSISRVSALRRSSSAAMAATRATRGSPRGSTSSAFLPVSFSTIATTTPQSRRPPLLEPFAGGSSSGSSSSSIINNAGSGRPQAPSSGLAAVVSRSSKRSKSTSSSSSSSTTTTGTNNGGGGGGREVPSIPLSSEEAQLFDTMLAVVEDEQLGTTLRVAGGWVRDKVLGHWNADGKVDIDIALDNMMGSEFAATLNRWLAKRGRQVYNVGIISANPEKSKHLETATMRVGSFWIDFVNLRTEAYTDESRIPSMDIGSPQEDALRRDLTINALYYNMNTGQIEDFTGRGLRDMREGVIRTPLPALTTLLDDPLRVLRAVRFASRLAFSISDDLVAAASDARVHKALESKVSRERIGSEVDLMIRSAQPARAMALIGELGLAATVFPPPPAEEGGEEKGGKEGGVAWYGMGLKALKEMEMGLRFRQWDLSPEDVRLALYAALLLPLAHMRYSEAKKKKVKAVPAKGGVGGDGKKGGSGGGGKTESGSNYLNKWSGKTAQSASAAAASAAAAAAAAAAAPASNHKEQEVSRYVFARMLKLKARDADKVALLHDVVDGFIPFLKLKEGGRQGGGELAEGKEKRATVGWLLLQVGPLWRAALLLAAVKCSVEGRERGREGGVIPMASTIKMVESTNKPKEDEGEDKYSYREAALTFSKYIQEVGLEAVWVEAPPFNGVGLRKVLPKIPNGPPFRIVMDRQIGIWLREPEIGDDEMAMTLREAFPEFW